MAENLETIVRSYDTLAEVNQEAEGLEGDPRSQELDEKTRKAALNKGRKIAYPHINSKDTPVNKPEDLDEKAVRTGLNSAAVKAREDASRVLYKNPKAVLEELSEEALNMLSQAEPIVKKAGKKYEEFLKANAVYMTYQSLVDRVGKYSKNSDKNKALAELDEQERKVLIEAAADRIGQERKEQYRAGGYTEKAQEVAAEAGRLAVRSGYLTPEILKRGAEGLRDQAKAELDKYQDKLDKSPREYIIDTVSGMLKGSRKDFEETAQLIYSVEKATQKKKGG